MIHLNTLLSKRGKAIAFPKSGIPAQSQEAKDTTINATIGIALEDDGSHMFLPSMHASLTLPPQEAFPYASTFGNRKLRQTWQSLLLKKNPSLATSTMSLPIITHALTHALHVVGHLFVDEADEIILPDLFWGNYKLLFAHTFGATLSTFLLFNNNAFNIQGLKEKLEGSAKKIVLLNFPNNPTGYSPSKQEAQQIVQTIHEAANDKPILLICDDAYFGLFYEEETCKESIAALIHHKNVLVAKIDGITKEEYAWGLRVGFLTFMGKQVTQEDKDMLEDKAAAVIRSSISNVSNLAQNMALHAFTSSSYEKEKQRNFELLHKRYNKVKSIITNYKNIEPLPFNSGYFMCVQPKNNNAEQIRKKLLKRGIGIIATNNLIRVAFSAVPEKDMEKLFTLIDEECA